MKNQQKIVQNAEENSPEQEIDAPDPRSSFDSYSCDNYSINRPPSKFFKPQQGSQAFDEDEKESEEESKSIVYFPAVKKTNKSEKSL